MLLTILGIWVACGVLGLLFYWKNFPDATIGITDIIACLVCICFGPVLLWAQLRLFYAENLDSVVWRKKPFDESDLK